ncbi:MAG: glucose-6-phosphate dehydrogenase [Candidatus Dormibacteraeota bacterium]|nr:glucose-6-phosphate dehydrogenase [Candidatus Dormibacteraeota bacterium]
MPDRSHNTTGALVIFGISGDLARKMTFRALYRLEARHRLQCPVIGVAKDDWSDDALRAKARQALTASGQVVSARVFERFAKRLTYVRGDFSEPATYQRVADALAGTRHPLFYLEVPPALFAPVVAALADAGLTKEARVVVEKPFGHDLASARQLNWDLHQHLGEGQILRIDHFLGKEPVMDLQFLRFANEVIEPIWNRDHVASVQISLAESFGVADRGQFYDAVGALRDVVQNHLLQVLALVAMEPPSGADADSLRDRKVDVLRAVAAANPKLAVRGQYVGYQSVPGVARGSQTETYLALRLGVDNWRWSGVPFFIRTGKALAQSATEVRLVFRRPPHLAFLGRSAPAHPNQLVLRIDFGAGLRVSLTSQGLGAAGLRGVNLDLSFAAELGDPPEPYERLLDDAMRGDQRLFTREDSVEESWRIVQSLIDAPPAVLPYPQGSWGPPAARRLVRGHLPWQVPWLGPVGGDSSN